MSITSWHMKDSHLGCAPKRVGGGGRHKNRPKAYTDANIEAFYQCVRDGYSVSYGIRTAGIPVSKAYDLLSVDKELRAIHERNKAMGFKK